MRKNPGSKGEGYTKAIAKLQAVISKKVEPITRRGADSSPIYLLHKAGCQT